MLKYTLFCCLSRRYYLFMEFRCSMSHLYWNNGNVSNHHFYPGGPALSLYYLLQTIHITVLLLTLQIFISSLLNIMEAGPNILTHCDTVYHRCLSVSPQKYIFTLSRSTASHVRIMIHIILLVNLFSIFFCGAFFVDKKVNQSDKWQIVNISVLHRQSKF